MYITGVTGREVSSQPIILPNGNPRNIVCSPTGGTGSNCKATDIDFNYRILYLFVSKDKKYTNYITVPIELGHGFC